MGTDSDLSRFAAHVLDSLRGSGARSIRRGAIVTGPVGSGVSSVLLEVCTIERAGGGRALHLTAHAFAALVATSLADAMEAIERLTPTLVAIDDASALDAHSLDVLCTLVLNAPMPFVVGTHTGASAEALAPVVHAVAQVDLAPLPPPLVGALCAGVLHGRVHSGTVNEVARRTAGWPGLVTDLVRHAHANGTLRETSGMFRFVSDPGLADATLRRVRALRATLDDHAQQQLERLALADGCVPGRVPGRTADLAAGLLPTRLVHEIDGRLRMATPVIADALVATTPSDRLARLADHLLATTDHPEESLGVRWQLAAGRTPPVDDIADAARRAHAAGDIWQAARLLALAEAAGDRSTATTLLRAGLTQETGDWTLGSTLLAQLLADPSLTPAHRGLVAAELANAKLWDLDEPDEAVAIARALRDAAVGTRWEATGAAVLGSIEVYRGRASIAAPLLAPVIASLNGRDTHPSLLAAASTALVLTGRCADGIEVADRAMAVRLRMQQQPGVPSLEVYANAQMMAHAEHGDLSRALEIADELMRDHSATGLRTGWLAIGRARVLVMTGALDEARRAADEAAVMFADLNRHACLRWAHAAQALVAAYQGRVAEASDAIAALDRLGPSAVGFIETDLERARAFHAAAAGDLSHARTLVRNAAEHAEALGNIALAAAAWHDLARLGDAPAASDALHRIVPQLTSRWNAPRIRHADCVAAGDPSGVLNAAEEFASLGAQLHALEAAVQAHAIAIATGNRGAAQQARAATALFEARCPGVRTPALRDLTAAPLTPREREVADLVAGGRSSKEVAGLLGVSVRTVDNLLQRVYSKLGVQGRVQLAEVLGQ